SPIFAPWALTVSCPEPYQAYILPNGNERNGAPALRDAYSSSGRRCHKFPTTQAREGSKCLSLICQASDLPRPRTSTTSKERSRGEQNGQAIVVHPSGRQFLVTGYRSA